MLVGKDNGGIIIYLGEKIKLDLHVLYYRSPEEGSGNALQYSCMGNPMAELPWGLQSMGSLESQT